VFNSCLLALGLRWEANLLCLIYYNMYISDVFWFEKYCWDYFEIFDLTAALNCCIIVVMNRLHVYV